MVGKLIAQERHSGPRFSILSGNSARFFQRGDDFREAGVFWIFGFGVFWWQQAEIEAPPACAGFEDAKGLFGDERGERQKELSVRQRAPRHFEKESDFTGDGGI
jgi:hypothetical protein